MKQSFLIIATILLLSACGSRNNAPETAQETKKTSNVIHLTAADFFTKVYNFETEELIYLGDKPAVIDFYATWCGPCKIIAPVLDELSIKYADSLYIYKIDVDKQLELAEMFGITSIPTLFFIPMNGNPRRVMGALPREELENLIKEILTPL